MSFICFNARLSVCVFVFVCVGVGGGLNKIKTPGPSISCYDNAGFNLFSVYSVGWGQNCLYFTLWQVGVGQIPQISQIMISVELMSF